MVQINFAKREINCKLVYYGPGLSGKTTNLEVVHKKAPASKKGELTSIATEGDRTLFFDYMPLELGKVGGMNTKFQLYTVPGQVYYNATRKLVLQGADGVVFVADSQPDKMEENHESFANLEENLREQGLDPKTIPMVLQWNKRDLPNVHTVEELDKALNKYGAPTFEAVAVTGEGVFPTLKKLAQVVLEKLNKEYGLQNEGGAPSAGPTSSAPATKQPTGGPKPAAKPEPAPKPEPKAEPEPAPAKKPEAKKPEAKKPEAKKPAPEPEPDADEDAPPPPPPKPEKKKPAAERAEKAEKAEKPAALPERKFNVVGSAEPEPKKGGKGILIVVLLLLAAAGGFVGAGFTGKLGPAQAFYDANLKPIIGPK
jgi:signal recognition particle receptor subunit beta